MRHLVDQAEDRLPPTMGALLRSARQKEVLLYAGGLAFYGLVSIVPFVVIGFWIAGWFVDEDGFRQMGDHLDEIMPAGTDVSSAIDTLATVGTGIGIGALISALWPATAYGSGLVRAFDRISERPEREFKGAHGRVRALLFVVLLPGFLLGALGTSYVTSSLVGDGGAGTVLGLALALVAGFAAAFVGIGAIYLLFGPGAMPPAAVATGAAVGATAVSVMSLGFALYLGQGADFEERVAGSGMAAAVLLALWLYLANTILLLGYALACSVAGDTPDPAEGGEGDPAEGEQAEGEPAEGEPADDGSGGQSEDSTSAATSDGSRAPSISSTAGSRTSSRR